MNEALGRVHGNGHPIGVEAVGDEVVAPAGGVVDKQVGDFGHGGEYAPQLRRIVGVLVFEVVEEGSDVGAQQFAGPVFRQVDVVIDLVTEVFDGVFGNGDEQFGAVVEVVHEPALGDAGRGGDGLDGYAKAFGDKAADGSVENTAAGVFSVPEATAGAA